MDPPPPLGQAEEDEKHPCMDEGLPPHALGGGVDRPPQLRRGGCAPISHGKFQRPLGKFPRYLP